MFFLLFVFLAHHQMQTNRLDYINYIIPAALRYEMFDSLMCCAFHCHFPNASLFYIVDFVNNRTGSRYMLFIHYAMPFSANILFKFNGNDTHEAIILIAHDDERPKTMKAIERQRKLR